MKFAQSQGWDTPEKAIKGSSQFLKNQYINRGQSTLYLQKFDVDSSDGSLYYHQYMQNLLASKNEATSMSKGHTNINTNMHFIIPVYKNMPQDPSPSPDGISIVTENVKVTGNDVSVRNGKSTSNGEIAKLKAGDVVLRIEIAGSKENGYYWDKVVLSNGAKGYIARDFITKIDDVTNCNTLAVANVNVNLRNGPGTNETKVIDTITSGQVVTVIENGKYNGLDGYNWSRVKLSNGIQGYLVSDYLTEMAKTNYTIAYINCNADGKVNIRSGIGTNTSIVTSLKKDTKVTVLQKSAGQANGYTWDKIVTSDGLEGYIDNEYLKYEEAKAEETKITVKDDYNCDVDGDKLIDSSDLFKIVKFLKDNGKYDKNLDVNKDGSVDSGDLFVIILYLKQH